MHGAAVGLGCWGVIGAAGAAECYRARMMSARYRRAVEDREKSKRSPYRALSKLQPEQKDKWSTKESVPFSFSDSLGFKINAYMWPSDKEKTKAIILYCHGLDGCCEFDLYHKPGFKFKGSLVQRFQQAGFSTWGLDYHGMGRSESVVAGHRSMCYSYDDYVDVIVQLFHLIKSENPDVPIVLMGCSMGGCVGVRAAEALGDALACAVFVCPALSFEKLKAKPENKILLPILGLVSTYLPWAFLGTKLPNDDPEIQKEVEEHPLLTWNRGKMRARYCAEGIFAGEAAVREGGKLVKPLLIVHCPADEFVDYQGSIDLLNQASTQDKTLMDINENVGHDSLFGGDYLKRLDTIIAWIDSRI
eukprot:gnl/MRDRNA2_/MRDRNA2_74422_c0_seq1.p1 gnl/MRDRNA2_/MRDRNA2_74422_c0~~gnl/MRDRNA2_/MRDRNA2_74422_c0_seq1.p1  ORF type:complete len:360 (+),score=72.77 gnl/MRDRNA2_/MRDRNA2_74422_c0_seq1:87-1166(+)